MLLSFGHRVSVIMLVFWGVLGCSEEGASDENATIDSAMQEYNDFGMLPDGSNASMNTPPPDREPCSVLETPIVMAHGFLGAGDTWSPHRRRFEANGWCGDALYAFDWNSMDRTGDHVADLAEFIRKVSQQHNVAQIDLIGHSAGGSLGYDYLSNLELFQTVRRYVHVGSFPTDRPPGPANGATVSTLNLWSAADTIVEGGAIPEVTNVMLTDADHYEVATNAESFETIYAFLIGVPPEVVEPERYEKPIVAGRYLTLGENKAVTDGRVEVWSLEAQSGTRTRSVGKFDVGADGRFGPLALRSDTRYEFTGTPGDERGATVRHFYEPFTSDNQLVYLRGFPGPGSIAGVLSNLLPKTAEQSTLVIYNARGAFVFGRDSLTLNGRELVTEDTGAAENTTIAFFIFDIGGDEVDGGRSPLFEMFPFLTAVDLPLFVEQGGTLDLNYNGRVITVPRSPGRDGILVAVYD